MMFIFSLDLQAQDTLAAWFFPEGSADSMVDVSISANSGRYLSCEFGVWGEPTWRALAIDYTYTGADAGNDKCAASQGWDEGADSIMWLIKFKTPGYKSLKLYSKQRSDSMMNYGPRDFKIQYKLSGSSTWNDITNDTIVCSEFWFDGTVHGIDLPAACENSSSNVSIRWLVTSNIDIYGATLLPTSISFIDDIVITGELITGTDQDHILQWPNMYPNPSDGHFIINNPENIQTITVYDMYGRCIYRNEKPDEKELDLYISEKGFYYVHFTDENKMLHTKKIVVY
jgi:hypothetical protein